MPAWRTLQATFSSATKVRSARPTHWWIAWRPLRAFAGFRTDGATSRRDRSGFRRCGKAGEGRLAIASFTLAFFVAFFSLFAVAVPSPPEVLRRICDEPEEFGFRSLNLVDDESEPEPDAKRTTFHDLLGKPVCCELIYSDASRQAADSFACRPYPCMPGSGTIWERTRTRSSFWKNSAPLASFEAWCGLGRGRQSEQMSRTPPPPARSSARASGPQPVSLR